VERAEALQRLENLVGKDLRKLADYYGITVWKSGRKNKGWPGHTIERYLGLPQNSSRAPNFGSWELKLVSLKYLRSGLLTVKETMAITMLDPVEVMSKEFCDSHLYNKLQKILVVARIFESQRDDSSLVYSVNDFDLDDPNIRSAVENDYNYIRNVIATKGFEALSSSMGKLIQPRTKGSGHGSTTRAFYARTAFVKMIVGL